MLQDHRKRLFRGRAGKIDPMKCVRQRLELANADLLDGYCAGGQGGEENAAFKKGSFAIDIAREQDL